MGKKEKSLTFDEALKTSRRIYRELKPGGPPVDEVVVYLYVRGQLSDADTKRVRQWTKTWKAWNEARHMMNAELAQREAASDDEQHIQLVAGDSVDASQGLLLLACAEESPDCITFRSPLPAHWGAKQPAVGVEYYPSLSATVVVVSDVPVDTETRLEGVWLLADGSDKLPDNETDPAIPAFWFRDFLPRPGDALSLTLQRAGSEKTVTLTIPTENTQDE